MATSLVFLSPLGALLIFGVLLPLGAVFLVRRRARRVRGALGLVEPRPARLFLTLGTMIAAGAFLGVAAAQPVIEQTTTARIRTDAEAYVVVDISRSMLARRGLQGEQRIDRAKRIARELRSSLRDIKFGVVSLTDRVLPHLFPSADADVFEATLERSLGIEQPPPRSSLATSATELDALAAIRTLRFFSPLSRKRLLVVLTDGETQPVGGARLGALLQRPPKIETLFVHLWHADERVYAGNVPEAQYQPDPSARAILDGIAESIDGSVYAEGDITPAAQKAQELLGSGPTVVRGREAGRVPLAPYLAAAALAPLVLLLRRLDR